jgi:hypothetical protein
MEEVEGTILDGDTVIVSGTTVLLDARDAPTGSTDGPGWHAHVSLPLDFVLGPCEDMRLELADGRSGPVTVLDAPTVEGDRVLHVLTGTGPLVAPAV